MFLGREKKGLRIHLANLNNNVVENFQEIAAVEKQLQRISEREIELALQNHPVFEHLNGALRARCGLHPVLMDLIIFLSQNFGNFSGSH
jgi:uncharacterized protein (DUF3084 family)